MALSTGKNRKSNQLVLILSIIVVFLVGAGLSVFFAIKADRLVRSGLLDRTQIISAAIDIDNAKLLSLADHNPGNPDYIDLKSRLREVVKLNTDTRFAYIAGISPNNEVFFYADSESADSPYYSPPGQIYTEASELFKSVFIDNISLTEGPLDDRWGSWITAFSPITDKDSGRVIAVIGIDINAYEYYRTVTLYTAPSLLISIIIICLIFFIYRINKKEEESLIMRSELLSIVAHDLRTPIMGIKWSMDSMMDGAKNLDEEQVKTLLLVKGAGDELLKITEEIIDTTKIDKKSRSALTLESCDLFKILDEATKLFIIPAKEKGLSIELDKSLSGPILVNCDLIKIKRAFSNLITNAIKYSSAGQPITISHCETPKTHIICISDKGIVIQENEKKNIFKEYYRTGKAAETAFGSGLGLYYVKRVIDLHGGRIWFESKEGGGTTFFVELPKAV